jgi:mannose-1-phosphate guanylyltransferase / mannose-6-phosphate isomerase
LARFVEKPDQPTAKLLLASGKHLWNSGIFLFRTDELLSSFERYQPEMLTSVRASLQKSKKDLSFTRLEPREWSQIADISIDYAIMEKAANLSVVPYGGFWSDLGGWEAVWREGTPDENGVVTQGEALAIDCTDTLLRSEAKTQEVVGIGLHNIIAVAMPDAVLIATKDRAQDVKLAIRALKAKGASQAEISLRDHRPWGWLENLAVGPRFQVKRIVVQPGEAISLQSHHHRAEHWIVVEGTARVTVEDKVQILTENQSIFIPLGAVHRLENPGKLHVVLIEVQTGSYFGEDDVVRYADKYARDQKAKD